MSRIIGISGRKQSGKSTTANYINGDILSRRDMVKGFGLDDEGKLLITTLMADGSEAVGEFADNLHERMIGLTGSPAQVKAASQAYRTYYKAQPADDEFYLVDHSTFSYLVLPENGFVEFFRREIQPEQMADTIQCFVNNS